MICGEYGHGSVIYIQLTKEKKEGETLYMKSCDFQIKSHDPITRLEIKSRDLNEMMCAQIKN